MVAERFTTTDSVLEISKVQGTKKMLKKMFKKYVVPTSTYQSTQIILAMLPETDIFWP